MKFLLKCCGRQDPIGVDPENVRLHFETDGSLQICSYTVQISQYTTKEPVCSLTGDGFTVWVPASALEEKTAYCWCVNAQLSDGSTVISQPGYFETGLQNWQGRWIGLPAEPGQVLEFCHKITLSGKPQKARLYICGLGYFKPMLNGSPLDESYYIPPVTDYTVRPQMAHANSGHCITYYTYDVTANLQQGENTLGALVAEGYYSNWEKAYYEPQEDMSFGQPGLIFELHIEDDSGSYRVVSGTDTQVRKTNMQARLFSGDEIYYNREPGCYEQAVCITPPTGAMTAPLCADDRIGKILTPVASWETAQGTVYDFGVNHSGGLQFAAIAKEQTTLRVRFAEVLNEDGSLNFETAAWHAEHIQTNEPKSIYQENVYHLQEGENNIEPTFGWRCYRYALISCDAFVDIRNMQSLFIHMDLEQDGTFACDHADLNRINDTFLQTLRCNMHSGIISDCPHREKLPYTGDGGIVMKAVCYNLSAQDFYYKWFRDVLNAQYDNGLIPNSAPYMGGGGGYAWGNALCVVAKELYRQTGDLTVARKGYDAIKKWLSYYESKQDENHIIWSNSHRWLLGDWLAPEVVRSNVYYISTVCYLQTVKTALFLAEILEPAACAKFKMLQTQIVDGINRVFFDEKNRTYGNGVQGENMLALAENIVPENYRDQMQEDLQHHYTVETDYHLDTGIVLTPVLIQYLTDHGFEDIAWRMMTTKTYPSYYNLMAEDSTFSEHWSKKWPDYYIGENGNSKLVKGGGDLSHCHPMYGSVCAWLYERVAGLDLSDLYEHTVLVKPYFMNMLSWAKAEKKTAFGKVCVKWNNTEEEKCLWVDIPAGLQAKCRFPAAFACLRNTQTGAVYNPDQNGFFDFMLPAGQWCLTADRVYEKTGNGQ